MNQHKRCLCYFPIGRRFACGECTYSRIDATASSGTVQCPPRFKSNIKEEYLDKYLSNNLTETELNSDTNVRYKISFEKICRMYKNAVDNGFASYAEA